MVNEHSAGRGRGNTVFQPSVQVVKYDALQETIKQCRGKVEFVDYWADYCVICKQEFPHLVQMQRKYAGDLAAVSVSLDDPSDEEAPTRPSASSRRRTPRSRT
jgi:thiol-disulfide isomerase/thioredoxin